MANNVEFRDFSMEVIAALDEATINWLDEASYEILAHAAENCQMTNEDKGQLRSMYRRELDASRGVAHVGSELESSYWEEFGTGSHADTRKNGGKQGRQGWWVYVKGQGPSPKVSAEYRDKDEAQAIADSMRADGLDAYATNGREPNYTLEKAFEANKNPLIARLNQLLKERMET